MLYSKDAKYTLFADMDIVQHEAGVYYVTDPSGSSFYSKDNTLIFRAPLSPNGLKVIKFQVVFPVYANAGEAPTNLTKLYHARYVVV